MQSEILSTPEAADHIHMSEDFVRRRLRYEVNVIQYAPRGPLFFRRSDLDMWIAKHTHSVAR